MGLRKRVVHEIIASSLTIATALVWVDVIKSFIELLVPHGEQLEYKLGAALIATLFSIFAMYLFLKTESEAEKMLRELREEFGYENVHRRSRRTNGRNRKIRR